jgi:hypothetical protein
VGIGNATLKNYGFQDVRGLSSDPKHRSPLNRMRHAKIEKVSGLIWRQTSVLATIND